MSGECRLQQFSALDPPHFEKERMLVMRRQWETEDLIDQWTLHAEERALLGNKTGATRLGFAVLLKYFQRTGRFPQHKNEVPGIVITYLATQVEVDAAAYLQYDWQGRTTQYHRAQIRAALGFREASVVPFTLPTHSPSLA